MRSRRRRRRPNFGRSAPGSARPEAAPPGAAPAPSGGAGRGAPLGSASAMSCPPEDSGRPAAPGSARRPAPNFAAARRPGPTSAEGGREGGAPRLPDAAPARPGAAPR